MNKHLSLILIAAFMMPVAALAQQAAVKAQAAVPVRAASTPAPQAVDADRAERVVWATKMIELTPPDETVNVIISRIAATAPADQRDTVQKKMTDAFEYPVLRTFVINTMADTFTLAELKKMVDYHSSPEAKSIAAKMPAYEAKVQPEMTKMIDVSLMVARTGGTPEHGPAAVPVQAPAQSAAPAAAPK